MDPRPQQPKKALKKEGKLSLSRDTEMKGLDPLEDRKIGNGSTLKFSSEGQFGQQILNRSDSELTPLPSSSQADPLNWPKWKKELAFGSLMLATATIGSLKTMFVTVNAVVATQLNVSYTSAAALTGVPLMMGALAGMCSQILSQMIGKRGLYLGSSILLLLAALWNMHVTSNYAEFMASRIFQGLAWGTFEVLISESITDLFFIHERTSRVNAHTLISLIFTYGTPVLGGYLSQTTQSYRNQIMVINIIQAISIPLLFLGHPETTYDRDLSIPPTSTPPTYLSTLRLTNPHSTHSFSKPTALQPLHALYAPSTLLTTLLSGPMTATALGTAMSLSLIFTSMPTFLFPSRLGYLFIAPLTMSLIFVASAMTLVYFRTKPPHHLSGTNSSIALSLAVPGLVVSVAGLLGLGMYTEDALMPSLIDSLSSGSIFVSGTLDLSLKTVSALFGLLVSGAAVLHYAALTNLRSSYSSTPNNNEGQEIPTLLSNGVLFWTEILSGVWCIGMPTWVQGAVDEDMVMVMGLKVTGIAVGVLGLVVGSTVGALLWAKGEGVRGVDGRVLGVSRGVGGRGGKVDGAGGRGLKRWDSGGSFMDV